MTTLNFAPLGKALNSLDRALTRALAATGDKELRDACIQRFKYGFELSWSSPIRGNLDTWSFEQMIRVAGERQLIGPATAV